MDVEVRWMRWGGVGEEEYQLILGQDKMRMGWGQDEERMGWGIGWNGRCLVVPTAGNHGEVGAGDGA